MIDFETAYNDLRRAVLAYEFALETDYAQGAIEYEHAMFRLAKKDLTRP